MSTPKGHLDMTDLSFAVGEIETMSRREKSAPAKTALGFSVSSANAANYGSTVHQLTGTHDTKQYAIEDKSSGDSDEDNEDGGVSITSVANNESLAVATQQVSELSGGSIRATIIEVLFTGEELGASTSYNNAVQPARNGDTSITMFRNFRLYSPAGDRTTPVFGPTYILFFSGWMNDLLHVTQFIDNLAVDETMMIRRLAFHDEFFFVHQQSLIPMLQEFYYLEAVFLVSEMTLENDPDPCNGPYAYPPDHVEFITMQYVMNPNSSLTRQQIPYTPMDRVHEVERAFQTDPNAQWPSPIKVDLVMVKRNGQLRSFDYNLYASSQTSK